MDISDLISRLCVERDKVITQKLVDLPDGMVLCVHEPQFKVLDGHFYDDQTKFRYTIDMHVVDHVGSCSLGGRHTQYYRDPETTNG